MDVFLSIIIPIYKIEEKYLRHCLDSLVSQDTKNFKVIMIDDGSPDNCGLICEEYSQKDNRFKVLHQSNSGVSVARNNGIKEVDTEWITFIDPDDWVESDHVSSLYKAQKYYKEADVILFDYYQEYDGKQVIKKLHNKEGKLTDSLVESLKISPFYSFVVNGKYIEYETNTIWNKMYKTCLIKDNNLFFDSKAKKGQDVIFNAEFFQLANNYYYIPKCLYHYRYLQNSITNRFNPKVQYYNEIAFENYERIINKYNLPLKYEKAYYSRIVTRLYSCMRLYYFHSSNTKTKTEINNEIHKTLSRKPYSEALMKVDPLYLSSSQKIFVFFLKRKKYNCLRFLVAGKLIIKNIIGAKLKK